MKPKSPALMLALSALASQLIQYERMQSLAKTSPQSLGFSPNANCGAFGPKRHTMAQQKQVGSRSAHRASVRFTKSLRYTPWGKQFA